MTLIVIIVITAIIAFLIANRQPRRKHQEGSGTLASQPARKTKFAFAERAYGGLPTIGGVVGAFVGGLIGFLLRPAAPIVGQLPLDAVITRGMDYRGLDQFLVSYAETSFNYLVVGLIIGGVGGALAAYAISRSSQEVASESPKAHQTSDPKTVELGLSPQEVEDALGQPQKKVNLGSKVIYVYNDLKVIFIEGKVDDVQ